MLPPALPAQPGIRQDPRASQSHASRGRRMASPHSRQSQDSAEPHPGHSTPPTPMIQNTGECPILPHMARRVRRDVAAWRPWRKIDKRLSACSLRQIAHPGSARGCRRATPIEKHYAERRGTSGRTLAEPPDCGRAAEPFLVRAELGDRGAPRSQPPGRAHAGQRMPGVATAADCCPSP
jgi:hypothetical protein